MGNLGKVEIAAQRGRCYGGECAKRMPFPDATSSSFLYCFQEGNCMFLEKILLVSEGPNSGDAN